MHIVQHIYFIIFLAQILKMINISGYLQEYCNDILVIFLLRTLDPDVEFFAGLLSNLSCVWVTDGLFRKGRFLRCKLWVSVQPVVFEPIPHGLIWEINGPQMWLFKLYKSPVILNDILLTYETVMSTESSQAAERL